MIQSCSLNKLVLAALACLSGAAAQADFRLVMAPSVPQPGGQSPGFVLIRGQAPIAQPPEAAPAPVPRPSAKAEKPKPVTKAKPKFRFPASGEASATPDPELQAEPALPQAPAQPAGEMPEQKDITGETAQAVWQVQSVTYGALFDSSSDRLNSTLKVQPETARSGPVGMQASEQPREAALQALVKEAQSRYASIRLIRITGYADPTGDARMNETLALRRAHAVRQWLRMNWPQSRDAEIQIQAGRPAPDDGQCRGLHGAALSDCHAPARKVHIQIMGAPHAGS